MNAQFSLFIKAEEIESWNNMLTFLPIVCSAYGTWNQFCECSDLEHKFYSIPRAQRSACSKSSVISDKQTNDSKHLQVLFVFDYEISVFSLDLRVILVQLPFLDN